MCPWNFPRLPFLGETLEGQAIFLLEIRYDPERRLAPQSHEILQRQAEGNIRSSFTG
jgi:hypothetical protein